MNGATAMDYSTRKLYVFNFVCIRWNWMMDSDGDDDGIIMMVFFTHHLERL